MLAKLSDDTPQISILLLDDNLADIEIIERYLNEVNHVGYSVDSFTNVNDATEYITHTSPDICLVDYNMGQHNALDFVNICREKSSSFIPIVVITGEADRELDQKLSNHNVDDVLSKDELNSHILERCIRYAYQRGLQIKSFCKEHERISTHLENFAHELKNPLSVIQIFSRILSRSLKENTSVEQKQFFGIVENNCQRINSLINELLDLAKIESGYLELSLTLTNIIPLIDDTVCSFEQLAKENHLKIIRKYSLSDKVELDIDPNRFWQIISNLISNAIKYTESGSITIEIKQDESSADNPHITVSISDTGIGISTDDFAALFDQFQTVHKNLNKSVDSTGLGLPIALKLVELHGGRIDVSSEIGKGSTFTVSIPQYQIIDSTLKGQQ